MATEAWIDTACRTDEELARRGVGPSPLADARHVVGELEEEIDPVMQGRGSRWLRRNRPAEWELLIDVLGLPEGEALTPWPPTDDDAWMVVCGREARADQAAVEAAYQAALAEPDPVQDGTEPDDKPAPIQRINWKWQDDAICTDDPLLFFGPDGERQPERDLRESLASELCSWCPVRTECLDYALSRPEKYGYWAGLNEDERKTERRRRQRRASYEAERRAASQAVAS
ncbi:WhiB family transcriptional regulator [Nonomuraea sp. NPDC050153]|uniref:WhiB family transcriptional regulator n=1 Tax=Nonomuraea sp. NPDC050153 TaxID=3364359 RepID=UPI0037883E50